MHARRCRGAPAARLRAPSQARAARQQACGASAPSSGSSAPRCCTARHCGKAITLRIGRRRTPVVVATSTTRSTLNIFKEDLTYIFQKYETPMTKQEITDKAKTTPPHTYNIFGGGDMYAASTASTTSGSGVVARGATGAERCVRVVRLLRPRRSAPAFGFSLRGGCEHNTGFFVSKVEFNSEAYHQGLKVGDQVVSVNGYRVEDAVHAEIVHYLAAQTRLKIKVRNVGMVPVKDKAHEPLSWQFVSERTSLSSVASSSPTLCHDSERLADLRLSLVVPPRAKLGCGICKGPEWKPGIFVQFVRDGGIARDAGLRPGDQILACNGRDFTNVAFNDAIAAMKATGRLELVVRAGVGVDLVSPESSGYNSSASSAAGERSPVAPATPGPPNTMAPPAPPAALRQRLASVAEEAADRVDRLNSTRLKRRTWDSLDWKKTDMHNFDVPSDIEPDYDSPSIPNNPHTFENQKRHMRKKDIVTTPSNRTIINLTENGATIQCSYEDKSPSKTMFSSSQYQAGRDDKKTIVVEVHHRTCAPPAHTLNHLPPEPQNNSDSSSLNSSTSLSSAIAEEIQRRKLNKKTTNDSNRPLPKKLNVPKTVDNEKKKQHDALMDEFKKVHQKMFANQEAKYDNNDLTRNSQENATDRQPTLPLRKTAVSTKSPNEDVLPRLNGDTIDKPPPPPPMPTSNGQSNGNVPHVNGKSNDINKLPNGLKPTPSREPTLPKNGTLKRIPTPDYNKTDNRGKEDAAELESLESYKLKNPSPGQPKPPSTYFVRAPNGTETMKKHAKTVSVTIGEYGSGRKEPAKLDFLAAEKQNGDSVDGPLTNRLQSELALTLSRSNLRKKTDSLDRSFGAKAKIDDDNKQDYSDDSLDKNFHARYGNNILPMPPVITIPKVSAKHSNAKIQNGHGNE